MYHFFFFAVIRKRQREDCYLGRYARDLQFSSRLLLYTLMLCVPNHNVPFPYQSHSNQLLPVLLFNQSSLMPCCFSLARYLASLYAFPLSCPIVSDSNEPVLPVSSYSTLSYFILPYPPLPPILTYPKRPHYTFHNPRSPHLAYRDLQHYTLSQLTHHKFENTLNTEAHYVVVF